METYTGRDNLEIMDLAVNYNNSLVEEVLKFSGDTKDVLDFGAGTGYFAERIQKQKQTVRCVEVDPILSQQLVQKGFKVHQSLGDVAASSVEYIYTLNVLEHIEDHQTVLRDMYRCLSKGGRIYIYVPAFNLLYSSMDKKVGHVRRYRISDIEAIVDTKQFKMINWGYTDFIGFFVTLLYKIMGNKQGDLNPTTVKIYDRILFPMNKILDLLFSKVLGKNLEVVLEKI